MQIIVFVHESDKAVGQIAKHKHGKYDRKHFAYFDLAFVRAFGFVKLKAVHIQLLVGVVDGDAWVAHVCLAFAAVSGRLVGADIL